MDNRLKNNLSFLLNARQIRKHLSKDYIFQTNDGYLIDKYISKNLKKYNKEEIEIMIKTLTNAKKDSESIQNKFFNTIAIFMAIIALMLTCIVTIYGSLFSSIVPVKDAQSLGILSINAVYIGACIIGVAYFIIFFGYYLYITSLSNKRSKLITVLKIALKNK